MKMTDDEKAKLLRDISRAAYGLRAIAHGDDDGGSTPTGLEALTMAISGGPANEEHSLAGSVRELADAVRDGLSDLADAIRDLKE